MRVFDLTAQEDDSVEFIERVKICTDWVARKLRPTEIFLIKVDNWFGDNWLGFSGKTLGQPGVWKSKLTVPPFVPHRIIWERRFAGLTCEQKPIREMIHVEAKGKQPQLRTVAEIAPNASLVWFSGSSLRNGRAALMAYLLYNNSYWILVHRLVRTRRLAH
ncbi:MAG: hypothetical protein ACRD8A_05425 [Candidatus Acidiferrales bacterium]